MMPLDLPMVSIVIPVYNGANYMREAINSALNQTYPNIEVIVVNDGSNDDGATHKIALSYKDKIRYYKKENGGVSSALNYGIKQMKGEYFAWLSHDDIHLPEKVKKQMDEIFKYKGNKPIICVCNYFLIDESGNELARSPYDIEKYFRKSSKCFLGSETNLMIDGDATLISKQVFDICGLFDESLFASQETDMWYRALDTAEFIFMHDYLVAYRSHSAQVTHKRMEEVGKESGTYRGKLIKQLTVKEMLNYYDNKKNAVRFGLTAYSYMYLFFYDASHELIKKLRQLCSINWKFTYTALSGMFEHGDAKKIFYILEKQLSKKKRKPRILVYCHDWIEGGLASNLKGLMQSLQCDYEFILVYFGDTDYDLPKNILSIRFSQNAQSRMAIYLALLAELFDVDIYWTNAVLFSTNANAISYLKCSHIRTIASFHYLEPTANIFSFNLNEEDWQSPLSNASLITHEQNDSMFTQYLYNYPSIIMSPVSGDIPSVKKWDMLFKDVLCGKNYIAKVQKDFSFIDAVEKSTLNPELLQTIQQYLNKYEDYVLRKHKKQYENSIYWRITKPMRVLLDLYRKLVK